MFDFVGPADIQHLLVTYGYLAVFIIVAVESMGVPLPGEMTLVAASIYAGTTHHLSLPVVILAAAAGAIAGDNGGYLIGRQGGMRLLQRYGRYVRLDEWKLDIAQRLFDRHGGKMVFFGRFVPVLRIWAGFLAGTHAMQWKRFALANAAGSVTWAASMGLGAYAFGGTAARVGGIAGLAVGGVALAVMAATFLGLRRGERHFTREAECDLPPVRLAAA